MRRWFGIALLGFVAVVASSGLYSLAHATDLDGWSITIVDLVVLLILLAGVLAVVSGVIGVGVAAIRGDRAR